MPKKKIKNPMNYARDIAKNWSLSIKDAEAVLERMGAKSVYGVRYALDSELDEYIKRLERETQAMELQQLSDAPVVDVLQPAQHFLTRMAGLELMSGVYFLVNERKLVYIGQSVNIIARVASHLPDKKFDEAYFIRVSPKFLDRVEGALIRYFRPPYNQNIPSGDRRKDMSVLAMYGFNLKRNADR